MRTYDYYDSEFENYEACEIGNDYDELYGMVSEILDYLRINPYKAFKERNYDSYDLAYEYGEADEDPTGSFSKCYESVDNRLNEIEEEFESFNDRLGDLEARMDKMSAFCEKLSGQMTSILEMQKYLCRVMSLTNLSFTGIQDGALSYNHSI